MMRWFQSLSLVKKTTLLVSVAASVFMLLLSYASYSVAHRELRQTIIANQTASVTSLATQLDEKLASTNGYLEHLAGHLQQHISNPAQLQRQLDLHDELSLYFDAGLLLLSPQGRIIAEIPYHQGRIGQDRSGREYYRQLIASGKRLVSPPYRLSLPPHQPVIAFTVPVKNRQGVLVGILVGRQSLLAKGYLSRLIDTPIGSSGYFYLIDRQRTLLIHPDQPRILSVVPAGKNRAFDQALQGQEGSWENVNSQDVAGITSIKKLKEADWFLAAHYPLAEAYAPLQRAKVAFGAVLAFSLLFAVVSVRYSLQPVVLPLKRLTDHLAHLGEKQGPDRFLSVSSSDEIGQLSVVFNELLQELDDDSAALEESAEVYRIVTEFTAEVSVWTLENGDIRYISPNCLEMFGCLAAEFYADPDLLISMIHPEDQQLWSGHRQGSCSVGGSGLEIRMVIKDGSIRYFRHFCHPVIGHLGQPNGTRSSWLDITGQHNLERTMRRLSRAVEQSASVIVMTDTEGTIQYVNPRFCITTGYPAEEAIGLNPRILTSGEMPPEGYADLWRTITSGKDWHGDFHNKRKDGSLYWESATISPLTDKNGSITGYLAVKEDITEQKANEQRIQQLFQQVEQAKQEWEQTLDHLHDFIILADADHRIRRFNRILADMSGQSVTDLMGRDWRELLSEAGFSFENFDGTRGELLHRSSARSYDINVYGIKGVDTDCNGFVVSMNDTTELRSATHELEQALEELGQVQSQIYQQEKMASIGQLAAGVAHEINNPMGFITSNMGSLDKYINRLSEFIGVMDQSMRDCGAAELTAPVLEARKRLKIDRILDDAHQLIAESLDGAGRVRRIVQDLKSFSRVDQAETALIDLNEALETTINIAWNEIKYVAELKREFDDIPKVPCYPQQLNQVFLNLLVNAAYALGETNGTITVATEQEGDWVLVKVSDTGCGMTPEVQRRIFEPFYTTKEVGKGTGLGLSISYDIIKKHGGEITVESEVGRGTVFTVRLPIDVQQEEA